MKATLNRFLVLVERFYCDLNQSGFNMMFMKMIMVNMDLKYKMKTLLQRN